AAGRRNQIGSGAPLLLSYVHLSAQKSLHDLFFRFFLGQSKGSQFDNLLPGNLADGSLVDQRSVNISREQLRSRVDSALPDEDGVAFRMSGTAAVASDLRVILLIGMILGYRTRDQIHTGILPLHIHLKICGCLLLAVRQDPLMYNQPGSGT